jgi:lysophospholipase L1-like esterase
VTAPCIEYDLMEMVKASLRYRLLVMVLAPILVFGVGEISLRIFGYRYDPYAALAGGETHTELEEVRLYRAHPELIWTLMPSAVLDDRYRGFVKAHTNSLGLRGEELSEGGGQLKVLCLGDSITFGLGLPDDETFPVQLAGELEACRDAPTGQVVVVNGGVPGWSSVQGRRLLDRFRAWDPDVVVFWFGINDSKKARGLPDSMHIVPAETVAVLSRPLRRLRVFQFLQQVLAPAPEPNPDARRASVEEFAEAVRVIGEEWGDRAIFIRCPERFNQTIGELRRMITDAELLGVNLIMGPYPLLNPWTPALDGTDLQGREMAVNRELVLVYEPDHAGTRVPLEDLHTNIELLFTLKREVDARLATLPPDAMGAQELFGGERPGKVFYDNCHLSPRGTALAARAVAARIMERLAADD